MKEFADHCCKKCTHTKDNPCNNFVLCCLEGPVCHENESCIKKRKAIIDKVALNEQFIIC